MTSQELQKRLRLVLSWRQQARRMQARTTATAHAGTEFDKVAIDTHLVAADTHLQDLRREGAALAQRQQAEIQRRLEEQERLPARVAAGKITPQAANDRNRVLAGEIAALRSDLERLGVLLQVSDAEACGGFIALPLDEYAPRVDLPGSARTTGFWRENRLTLIIAPIVLVVGVVLVLYFRVWSDTVQFNAMLPAAPGQPLLLECKNNTLTPVFWHVPRQDNAEGGAGKEYGVEIYLRESPEQEPQRYLPSQPVFYYDGRHTSAGVPIEVPPGLSKQVTLNLEELRMIAPNAQSATIVCTTARGSVVYSIAVDPL